MKRTLISDLSEKIGEEALICGRVLNIRDLGGVTFLVIQDRTGKIQTVIKEKNVDIQLGEVVEIKGIPEEDERAEGGVELSIEDLKVISNNYEDLPFDISKDNLKLKLDSLLNHRTTAIRHPKIQAIFKLYSSFLENYTKVLSEDDFIKIKTPKLLSAASEGGADFFKVDYFEREAYLAQSPQLYKQIMAGAFERVFEIGPAFRAEPHVTSRHVNEYTSCDAELSFIDSFRDVTKKLTQTLRGVFNGMRTEENKKYLKEYGKEIPEVPEEIPHVKLSKIKEIIEKKYDYKVPESTDIDPKGERLAGRYAKEEFDSDFIFITHYPWEKSPFYTMQSSENPEETYSFDLLFKGVEIVTGSQRINDYEELIENMRKKGIEPDGLEFYLDTFKYAMPPHGGWGMGSERVIQQILELDNIKEAILFPRDMKRLAP